MKTLRQLLEEYLEHQRSLKFSAYTSRSVRYNVGDFLGWLDRAHRVRGPEALRSRHLQAWLAHLARRKTSRGHPLKPRTVNKHIETVRGFLAYLVAPGPAFSARILASLEYVKEPPAAAHQRADPCAGQEAGRPHRRLHRRRATGTAPWSSCSTPSGIRVGELLGLNLGDLDLTNGTAVVLGKGSKQRVVPVGKTALRYLETYLVAVRPCLAADPAERALFLDEPVAAACPTTPCAGSCTGMPRRPALRSR